MYTATTAVVNKLGIHARPASDLTLTAKKFQSVITITNLDSPTPKPINAKSVMKLLAASISMGNKVEISAEGEDEKEAVDEMVKLFDSGFSEE